MTKLALSTDIGQDLWLRTGQGISGRYGTLESLGTFAGNILPNALIIAGVVGFFLLLIGGIAYIVEAGKGNQEGIAKILKWMTSVFFGLVIVFVSYWLVKLVEVITGFRIISP